MRDPWICANCCRPLGGGHILTLPPKGVADAIDKVEETTLVFSHQVSGAYPGVSMFEDIAEDLFIGILLGRVTLKAAADVRRVGHDFAKRLTGLVWCAPDTKPLSVTDWLARLHIEQHQCWRESMRQIRWNVADRPAFSLNVEQGNTSLCRSIEFENSWNAKTFLERIPNLRRQAIAAGKPNSMLRFVYGCR